MSDPPAIGDGGVPVKNPLRMTFEQLNSLPLWRRMPTLSLDEMSAVKLMNRVDTKYVLGEKQCLEMLRMAADDYSVQTIGECRACRYATLYYDTADRRMYTLHHDRHLARQKIRTRTYVESGVSFVEVKDKTNKGRTKKRRMHIADDAFAAVTRDEGAVGFLRAAAHYAPETITPALATTFERITLVNHARTERLTIDWNLRFTDVRARGGTVADPHLCAAGVRDGALSLAADVDGMTARVDGMVIVELKQDGLAPSPMKRILGQLRIRPLKVSKYCIGTALSVPQAKSNRFKAKIRRIIKAINGKTDNA